MMDQIELSCQVPITIAVLGVDPACCGVCRFKSQLKFAGIQYGFDYYSCLLFGNVCQPQMSDKSRACRCAKCIEIFGGCK